jgi:hypothetical protein
MAETTSQLLATDAAWVKLGARDISTAEAEQLPRNRHATARNPRIPACWTARFQERSRAMGDTSAMTKGRSSR